MNRLIFLAVLSGVFVLGLSACTLSNGEDMVAVEPPTSLPTSQPSHTPRPSWTPWPTQTSTPVPTATKDPRAAFITPETEVVRLPQVDPLAALQDRDLPPGMVSNQEDANPAQAAGQAGTNNNSLFSGLTSEILSATPTPRASATATPTSTPQPTNTSTATPTETPTARSSATVVADSATPRPTLDFIPTNTPGCFNFLQFVDDVTIPDGEQIEPGAEFTKTWRVVNLGSCYISPSYRFFALNDSIEVVAIEPLPLIGPDEEGNLSVTLRAPIAPGRYRSNWQLDPADGSGEPFGQLYLEIIVPE